MQKTTPDDRHGLATFSVFISCVGFYFWLYPELGLLICAIAVAMGQYSKEAVFPAYGSFGL